MIWLRVYHNFRDHKVNANIKFIKFQEYFKLEAFYLYF